MICSKQCLYLVLGKYHYGLHIVTELVLGVRGWQRGMGWVCGLWGSDIDFNVTWPTSTFGGWRERRENGTCSSRKWSEIIYRPQISLGSPATILEFLILIQIDTEEKESWRFFSCIPTCWFLFVHRFSLLVQFHQCSVNAFVLRLPLPVGKTDEVWEP